MSEASKYTIPTRRNVVLERHAWQNRANLYGMITHALNNRPAAVTAPIRVDYDFLGDSFKSRDDLDIRFKFFADRAERLSAKWCDQVRARLNNPNLHEQEIPGTEVGSKDSDTTVRFIFSRGVDYVMRLYREAYRGNPADPQWPAARFYIQTPKGRIWIRDLLGDPLQEIVDQITQLNKQTE